MYQCTLWSYRFLVKKAYESVAYISCAENTICQLLFTATITLELANVNPSILQFLQTALLAMGHVTHKLVSLTATLLAALDSTSLCHIKATFSLARYTSVTAPSKALCY